MVNNISSNSNTISEAVKDKLQAIATRYSQLYGCENAKVAIQGGKKGFRLPGEDIVFQIDYTSNDMSARQMYLMLRNIDYNHVVERACKDSNGATVHSIVYTSTPVVPLGKVMAGLDFALRDVGHQERAKIQKKLASLLKCSVVMGDAEALAPARTEHPKDWGTVQENGYGAFDIQLPKGMANDDTRKRVMDYMVTALEGSQAGRIAFPAKNEVRFTMAKPANVVLHRLQYATAGMEDDIPIHFPAPLWRQKVQVSKNKIFSVDYLHGLFPDSIIVMSPQEKPAEIHLEAQGTATKKHNQGMDRLIKLLPDSREMTLHEKKTGIEIVLHLSPAELMLRVIGSKEKADEKFVNSFSRNNPGIGK